MRTIADNGLELKSKLEKWKHSAETGQRVLKSCEKDEDDQPDPSDEARSGELQNKLEKWKQSAETGKRINKASRDEDDDEGQDGLSENFCTKPPPLPEKPAKFRLKQLQKMLDGKLDPPKSWNEKEISW